MLTKARISVHGLARGSLRWAAVACTPTHLACGGQVHASPLASKGGQRLRQRAANLPARMLHHSKGSLRPGHRSPFTVHVHMRWANAARRHRKSQGKASRSSPEEERWAQGGAQFAAKGPERSARGRRKEWAGAKRGKKHESKSSSCMYCMYVWDIPGMLCGMVDGTGRLPRHSAVWAPGSRWRSHGAGWCRRLEQSGSQPLEGLCTAAAILCR